MSDIGPETSAGLPSKTDVNNMDQDQLYSCIADIEKTEFPQTRNSTTHEDAYGYDSANHFFFFRPSHHIAAGLINPGIISDLQQTNHQLLSVGAGPALLEQLLTRRFGINSTAITLADINREKIPNNFNFHQFDMFGEWPETLGKFEYIIFPQALIAISNKPSSSWGDALSKLFSNALDHLDEGGQIRLTGMSPQSEAHAPIIQAAHQGILSKFPHAKLDVDRETIVLSSPKAVN